ncbi:coiled-coil domain-containing protein 152-like [Saccoglossus kowalevskii]|uniref:Coiled-coil domain-containing protein 152-like n=1 Tax=Saccoglossus kowalevskii TaxID=10224 RepID=A0ABM0M3J0_SACKO|nr:PREDICTED: coiled-coil domain-containing protein 152-like [Saccoglossus kowalevskii]
MAGDNADAPGGATTELTCEVTNLEVQLKTANSQILGCQANEKSILQDKNKLRSLVDKLQETLAVRCDVEDQNGILKERVAKLEEELTVVRQEHEINLCDQVEKLEKLKENHHEELKKNQMDTKHKVEQVKMSVQKELQCKQEELQQFQKQLEALRKEKHTEIVKLRLEYDAKLLSLQKQNQKATQMMRGQSNAANSEIFRKKWQHMKTQSDREIASLKRTVGDLQKKLDTQATASKRRKF